MEQRVALARAIVLSAGAVMTVLSRVFDPESPTMPIIVFGVGAAFALALLAFTRRRQTGHGVAIAAITADLLIMTGTYPLVQRFELPASSTPMDELAWPALMLPISVLMVVLIDSLRASRVTALYASIAGAIAFQVSFSSMHDWWNAGWRIGVLIVTALILLGGVISYIAAGESRRFLERYARYELLKRWLPAEAVRRVLVDDRPLALGGRKLPLTIVATDLRGFTSMSEGLTPEELLEQLNGYHGVMLECVEKNGGMLDKFIGDGALAVFGVRSDESQASDDGAAPAVACARDMLTALVALNESRASRKLPPLAMGIGIHTGEVVLGNIGAPGRRLELTVIGDAANTASRLESATKELGVPLVVSEATVKRLDGANGAFRALGNVAVRGRKEPVTVMTLHDLRP